MNHARVQPGSCHAVSNSQQQQQLPGTASSTSAFYNQKLHPQATAAAVKLAVVQPSGAANIQLPHPIAESSNYTQKQYVATIPYYTTSG
jgi:hypothetical protein